MPGPNPPYHALKATASASGTRLKAAAPLRMNATPIAVPSRTAGTVRAYALNRRADNDMNQLLVQLSCSGRGTNSLQERCRSTVHEKFNQSRDLRCRHVRLVYKRATLGATLTPGMNAETCG